MKRLRLNGPLALGLLLALCLMVILVLPWVISLKDPHMGQLVFWIDHLVRWPPLTLGQQGFVLGTDAIGRDMLSRFVLGARMSLGLALGITVLRCLIAIPLGLLAGWRGGWLGRLTAAVGVGFGAVPTLLLVVLCLSSLRNLIAEPNAWLLTYVAVVVLAGFPRMAEHVRHRTQEISLQPYIEAALATGASSWRLVGKHVVPVITGDLLVMVATEMAWVLVMMGQLAIFGLFGGGSITILRESKPPLVVEYTAEWGQMLGANRWLFRTTPWVPLLPALGLGASAFCFHMLAEGARLRWLRRS